MLRALLGLNRAMMSGESMPKIESGLRPAPRGEVEEKRVQLLIEQLAEEWGVSDIDVSIPMKMGEYAHRCAIKETMWRPYLASPLGIVLLTSLLPQFE